MPVVDRVRIGVVTGFTLFALTACAAFEVAEDEHMEGDHDGVDEHMEDDRPEDDHAEGDHGEGDSEPIDGAPEQDVTGEALAFSPNSVSLRAGEPINIRLTSADILHDLVVDEVDFHLAADGGETRTGGLLIPEPGDYVGYCSVPGHRDAGMEMQISVS